MEEKFDIIDLNEGTSNEEVSSSVETKRKYGSYLKESLINYLIKLGLFTCLLVFVETAFHVWAFKNISTVFFLKLALCIPTAFVFSLFCSFFSELANKIVGSIAFVIIELFYGAHILYKSIFKIFLSIEFVDKNNVKVVQYYREILKGIADNIVILLIVFFLPLIAYFLLLGFKKINYKKVYLRCAYIPLALALIIVTGIYFLIPVYGKEEYSPYELIYYENSADYSFMELGVIATNEIQLKNVLAPASVELSDDLEDLDVWVYVPTENDEIVNTVSDNDGESEDTIAEIVKKIDTSPNILDIDFVSLGENEADETYASISKYLSGIEPSYKNEYTGMFKGFNLILMTCEGFSNVAVDEDITPTLYRLTHEGFVFNNFYNPKTGGSTSDGEFVVTTSLEPTNGGAKNYKIVGQNAMPFSVGNMFNRAYNIQSRAYHDNDFQYYGRDISYPSMGYYYQGVGNGVEVSKHWPESDLEMMQTTIPEYIDDDLFNIYYMTVSGHLNYSFSGNYMSSKNKDYVKDLPYSEACRAYLACQIELDRALEYLINQLEEKGIADRTVICFTGDHWPYGLDNNQFSELLGHPVEEDFELYKSNLVLWSEAIKEPIYIDKVCCSLDIVPTLMNLFGFEYDSRLYMGRDILSNTEGFVLFLNKSYITDKISYNSRTKEYTYFTDEEITEDYLKECKKNVNYRWNVSQKIMDSDYYKYIADYLSIDVYNAEQNYVPDYSRFTR